MTDRQPPKISIIMPTYNRAWIIKRAIDSALAQTYQDFELLIVDDGSTDDTDTVLKQYSDTRIRLFSNDHAGACHARNTAIHQARGKYIAYLDTDNTMEPTFLERMLAELVDPYLLVYAGQQMYLMEGPKETARVRAVKTRNPGYNPIELLDHNYIDMGAVLHRAEIFKLIGTFDEQLTSLEDWDLWVRLALCRPFSIKHVDRVLTNYYYYMQGSAETVTNKSASDAKLSREFSLPVSDGADEQRIFDKISVSLDKTSANDIAAS